MKKERKQNPPQVTPGQRLLASRYRQLKSILMRLLLISVMLILSEGLFSQDTVNPSFIGGEQAMYEFIAKNIRYPEVAKESGIQGRIVTSFVIKPDSSISDIIIAHRIGGGCDEEALRVINLMKGKWIPANVRGEPIKATYLLPLSFSLNGVTPPSTNNEMTFVFDNYEIGLELIKQEKFQEAISFLSFYKTKDYVHLDALYVLGLCNFLLDDNKNAIKCWEEAKGLGFNECKPKLAEAYMKIGNQYLNEKKYQAAQVCFTKSLDNSPVDMNVLFNRGISYLYIGEKEKACTDWQMAKDLGLQEAQSAIDEYCKK